MKRFFFNGKRGFCHYDDLNRDCCGCEFLSGTGGEHREVPDLNPYWERICKLSDRQRAKGLEKYGLGLESNPGAILERIEHLQEELIDGLMYCEWIKDKLMELNDGTE